MIEVQPSLAKDFGRESFFEETDLFFFSFEFGGDFAGNDSELLVVVVFKPALCLLDHRVILLVMLGLVFHLFEESWGGSEGRTILLLLLELFERQLLVEG